MKKIALSEAKDQLSKFPHAAEKEEILILRHGKPAGVLIGFASEDDWVDYQIENDPRFLARIERARHSLRAGRGVRLEDIPQDPTSSARQGRPTARGASTRRRTHA